MKRNSRFLKIAAVLLCMTFIFGCTANTITQAGGASHGAAVEQASSNTVKISSLVTYDERDYYSSWENEKPVYIELSGCGASINGSGAEVKDGNIAITAAGVYVLSGKLDDGQITVDVQDRGTVKLVLNGAEINCSDNAAIYVMNAGKTVVSLPEGTENTVSDGKEHINAEASEDEPNAAIYCKDSLTINGNGKLTVNGNYKDGITTKDELKITGGNITISAADDGMTGRDMVAAKDGNVSIKAVGDGIKSTNDEDSEKGFIAIEGGSFDIKSGADGIQAETSLYIDDGIYMVTTGGGSVNSSHKAGEMENGPWGDISAADEAEKASAKALKASAEIIINGGTFEIDSSDDSVHSNGSVAVYGGNISITSGDDGIHGDSEIMIAGGEINMSKSYEGIESAMITLAEGNIHVTSSDDGINVAGGNDGSAVNGRPGQNNFSTSSDNKLVISGGYVVVNSSGDGLDANGSIYMSSGTVLVNGPVSNGNGSVDYDGVFELTGGVLAAAGSSGMAQAASEQSTQYSILMTYPETQKAGTMVYVADGSGDVIAAFIPEKDYQAVLISSPELKKDSTYSLYSGGVSTGTATDGFYSDGKAKDGIKLVEFKLSEAVTWLDETGVTEGRSQGMGGPGMRGPGSPQGHGGEQDPANN